MATKIQIDVIGKLENSQFVKCKLYIDGEATRILMPETEYHCLIQDAYSGGYPFSISGDIRSVPS